MHHAGIPQTIVYIAHLGALCNFIAIVQSLWHKQPYSCSRQKPQQNGYPISIYGQYYI